MSANYTPLATKVFGLAAKEAVRLKFEHIGSELLLLGLLRLSEGIAHDVLLTIDVDIGAICNTIEHIIGVGPVAEESASTSQRVYTPITKKILALAQKEAGDLGMVQVGPEHILLAFLKEDKSKAGALLKGQNVDWTKVQSLIKVAYEHGLAGHTSASIDLVQVRGLVELPADFKNNLDSIRARLPQPPAVRWYRGVCNPQDINSALEKADETERLNITKRIWATICTKMVTGSDKGSYKTFLFSVSADGTEFVVWASTTGGGFDHLSVNEHAYFHVKGTPHAVSHYRGMFMTCTSIIG